MIESDLIRLRTREPLLEPCDVRRDRARHTTLLLSNASHFLQEDRPVDVAALLADFVTTRVA